MQSFFDNSNSAENLAKISLPALAPAGVVPAPHFLPAAIVTPEAISTPSKVASRSSIATADKTINMTRAIGALPIGEVVSFWQIGDPITGGRWYDIYRAAPKNASPENGFGFVIKLVNPNLPADQIPQALDRLGREALATEQILHPNVVRLLDAELDRAPFFLVQPWLEGRSLDHFLSASTQMSLSRILWAIRQIAEGIRAAHDKGRVHLGLDPSHVILGKTGRATLLGWSQSHASGEQVWLPHDQLQLARYTAPECFDADYIADTAADVYSLGALIYHAMAMRPPFIQPSIAAMATAHQEDLCEDLQFIQPLCPPVLSSLVKEMLLKNPERRPSFTGVLNRLIAIEIEHLNDLTMLPL